MVELRYHFRHLVSRSVLMVLLDNRNRFLLFVDDDFVRVMRL